MDYWRGFVTALLMVELLAFGYLAFAALAVERMIADFGELDGLSRPTAFVVVTSGWYPVLAGGALGVAAVFADRRSATGRARVIGLGVVCLVGAVVVAFTWHGLYSPIHALTDAIE